MKGMLVASLENMLFAVWKKGQMRCTALMYSVLVLIFAALIELSLGFLVRYFGILKMLASICSCVQLVYIMFV